MNNYKAIEQLIEKYFEGETSTDEEKQLQEFFKAGDVPANLKVHQAWFSQLKLRSETSWDGFSEDKLLIFRRIGFRYFSPLHQQLSLSFVKLFIEFT